MKSSRNNTLFDTFKSGLPFRYGLYTWRRDWAVCRHRFFRHSHRLAPRFRVISRGRRSPTLSRLSARRGSSRLPSFFLWFSIFLLMSNLVCDGSDVNRGLVPFDMTRSSSRTLFGEGTRTKSHDVSTHIEQDNDKNITSSTCRRCHLLRRDLLHQPRRIIGIIAIMRGHR